MLYTSPANSLGRGNRDAAHKIVTSWVPGPNAYDVQKDTSKNDASKYKIGTSKRYEQLIHPYPGPNHYHKDEQYSKYVHSGPQYTMGAKKEEKPEKDGLAPNTYIIKSSSTAPTYSFGSRFDTDIRSKNHVKHEKVDKPAPGTYSPPDRQFEYPTTRFSKAERKSFAANPSYPGPDSYQP